MKDKCENCGVGHGPDDMFCENCGYDFITGSLPVDADQPSAPSASAPSLLNPPPDSGGANGANGTAGEGQAESSETPASGADPLVGVPRLVITVAVDREFFDAVVSDGELKFPDPAPREQRIEVSGDEIHIGRTSESRAIHPDIDVADLTGDKAASSRHAVVRVGADGACTVTDVGSTNGTFVEAADSKPIEQGFTVVIEPGTPFYVGAWTRLVIVEKS